MAETAWRGPAARRRAGRRLAGRRLAGPEAVLTLALAAALAAAFAPLLTVIHPGEWVAASAALALVLLACGFALRRAGAPGGVATAALVVVWIIAVTAVAFPGDALWGMFPTAATLESLTATLQQAGHEIYIGVPPIAPTAAISLVVVAATGLLTIIADHVVLTARMPVLATIALVAVWVVPAIATSAPIAVLSFVLLAAACLALVRADQSTRERAATPAHARGVGLVATASAAAAIAVALVVAPSLPAPAFRTVVGSGPTLDATLDLGENLRRPTSIPILKMSGRGADLPYLRVATYSGLEGDVWQPDRLRSQPLTASSLGPVVTAPGVAVDEVETEVEIQQLSSAFLPVPFPAVEVTGLDGLWRSVAYNRTVLTAQASVQGQRYTAVAAVPAPSLEQMNAARAALQSTYVPLDRLPEGVPAIVSERAAEITAAAQTDYERLLALQSWLRGDDFTYSLDAPVEGGFDGSGADAVARFLEVREGYCVHFASAFTLMARSLGMPARLVVGFLPGPIARDGGQYSSEVTTDQFHAWPEVYFEGVGWVGFEPTKSLGTPTEFLPAAENGEGGPDASPTPSVSVTVTPPPTQGPADVDTDDGGAPLDTRHLVDIRPFLAVMGTVVVIALLPLALSTIRRALLRRRARRGSVSAAWRIVRETAVDLGAAAPSAETPREFGARIIADVGAPAVETRRLVDAVERASYARSAVLDADAVLADAGAVRAGMLAAAEGRTRAIALLLPRSLVVTTG